MHARCWSPHPPPTSPAQVDDVIGQVVERFGRLDGVANCVGSIVLKPAHQTSEAEFEQASPCSVGCVTRMWGRLRSLTHAVHLCRSQRPHREGGRGVLPSQTQL